MIFKFLFLIIILYNSLANAQQIIKGNAKIIDGDTINLGKYKIRLHGIDAPEINQTCEFNKIDWFCGVESTKFLRNYTFKKKVSCEIIGTDKYKRLIGICFVENININKLMVISGWAIAYRYYSKDYILEEEIAKKNKVGIWRGKFIEPYLFRKNQ